ncbi:MAG: metallophosphatase family protein [Defluviitaleaceae bacterium]|nr:metallophosphatase family protein [Defluviitaleaceae bacterium]
MKYAIISDIHGNLPAFKATLADAEARKIDKYLFIGDYANSFPWGNEVTEIIRGLKNAVVIRGNGEDYYTNLKRDGDFSYEQFKPVYWAYRHLSDENLDYLTGLPETAVVSDSGINIYLNHSMDLFFRTPKIELFHSYEFRAMMMRELFPRTEYLHRAREAFLSCAEAVLEVQTLPKGVHLFGHNHMQFHMEFDGRLFINPGSCGEPLDWDTTAAYTILTCDNNGWSVDERRVNYNINEVAEGLVNSGFAAYAPMWSKVMELELQTASDYFMSFVLHIADTGRKLGKTEFPLSNDVWNIAIESWDINK